jgi:hypothetical protein
MCPANHSGKMSHCLNKKTTLISRKRDDLDIASRKTDARDIGMFYLKCLGDRVVFEASMEDLRHMVLCHPGKYFELFHVARMRYDKLTDVWQDMR